MIDEYLRNWILKAKNDLKVVKHELDLPEEEITTDAVCFHCQQAVEKFLKAYLIFKDVDFEKTHALELLLKLCSEKDSEFKTLNIRNLTDYAVEVRYPDEFYIPTVAEARECFKICLDVKEFVFKKLGIKEKDL